MWTRTGLGARFRAGTRTGAWFRVWRLGPRAIAPVPWHGHNRLNHYVADVGLRRLLGGRAFKDQRRLIADLHTDVGKSLGGKAGQNNQHQKVLIY